jgi:hypothetical protein
MEIFLPSDQAAAVKNGAEARITLDYESGRAAAGYVSFVSPEAQFTPKQVETRSERDKLMFRVKIQLPQELVVHYIDAISAFWNDYMKAYEDVVRNTSSPEAPWYVVPADNKWFTRIVVAAAVIEALDALDLRYPKVSKEKLKELAAAKRTLVGDRK